jgi:CheY-like chemotaxis protein
MRVLVVDDSRDTLVLLEKLLSKFDCEVRTCQNSSQAVSMAQDFAPHVIFLDIDMPRLDGYEVAEDLHELNLPNYMLVAVTSYTDEAHRQECVASGFNRFLSKPVSIDDLAGVIKAAKARISS